MFIHKKQPWRTPHTTLSSATPLSQLNYESSQILLVVFQTIKGVAAVLDTMATADQGLEQFKNPDKGS